MVRAAVLCLVLAVAFPAAHAADVTPIPVAPQPGAAITIYGNDLAMVRDHRVFRLPTAEAQLDLTGITRRIQPETAFLEIAPGPQVRPADVRIIEQTFAVDAITPQTLLQQSVGQEVSIVTTNPATGRETSERGKILSAQDGVVLDIGGKIYSGAPGRIVFDALPPHLKPTPVLVLDVAGPTGTDIGADLSYLTGGLAWHADYIAQYDGERLDLTGWATIRNTSGVDFKDAKLTLAAGDVNRLTPPTLQPLRAAQVQMAPAAMPAPPPKGESLAELYLYPIDRAATLATGDSLQLPLLRAIDLPVRHDYVVRGQPSFYVMPMAGQPVHGGAEIEAVFKNEPVKPENPRAKSKSKPDTENDAVGRTAELGFALPAGTVRAYGTDAAGVPQFLGEDRIDHVPEGGEVRLRLGQDLDIPVLREQTAFARASDTVTVSGWRITIRNTKAKPVTVRIDEPLSGNWEISRETQPHTTSADGTPEWTFTVPPKGQAVLEYNVKAQV